MVVLWVVQIGRLYPHFASYEIMNYGFHQHHIHFQHLHRQHHNELSNSTLHCQKGQLPHLPQTYRRVTLSNTCCVWRDAYPVAFQDNPSVFSFVVVTQICDLECQLCGREGGTFHCALQRLSANPYFQWAALSLGFLQSCPIPQMWSHFFAQSSQGWVRDLLLDGEEKLLWHMEVRH